VEWGKGVPKDRNVNTRQEVCEWELCTREAI
jgi:hypothetical protein